MTSRERVLKAMNREQPDRIPCDLSWGMTPGAMEVFIRNTGGSIAPEEYFDTDVRLVDFKLPPADAQRYSGYFEPWRNDPLFSITPWGVGQLRSADSEYHFAHIISPLRDAQTIQEIESFPLPDIMAPACWQHLPEEIKKLHMRGLAAVGPGDLTIFETAWQLRGYEEFMIDMLQEPDMACCLLGRIARLRLAQAKKLVEVGVDVLMSGDDVCGQRGMLFSIELFQTFLKPLYAKLIDEVLHVRKLPIFYHTDGKLDKITDELIDIGVDVLNPCQSECNDLIQIKSRYGGKLAMWGCVGTQRLLPFATPAQIRRAIKSLAAQLGVGGGLLLGPTHMIEPEVPWENMVALYEAIHEYGTV